MTLGVSNLEENINVMMQAKILNIVSLKTLAIKYHFWNGLTAWMVIGIAKIQKPNTLRK